jgi:hypothetical protein
MVGSIGQTRDRSNRVDCISKDVFWAFKGEGMDYIDKAVSSKLQKRCQLMIELELPAHLYAVKHLFGVCKIFVMILISSCADMKCYI